MVNKRLSNQKWKYLCIYKQICSLYIHTYKIVYYIHCFSPSYSSLMYFWHHFISVFRRFLILFYFLEFYCMDIVNKYLLKYHVWSTFLSSDISVNKTNKNSFPHRAYGLLRIIIIYLISFLINILIVCNLLLL